MAGYRNIDRKAMRGLENISNEWELTGICVILTGKVGQTPGV